MTAMLADQDRDRRQLRDLTPPGPPGRHPLLSGEVITAAPAAFRIVVDELVDQILALERTTRALMPGLAAGRTPLGIACQQLLRLRPRLRSPLLTRLRRIL